MSQRAREILRYMARFEDGDPLEGVRKKLNEGALDRLAWPDKGKGSPVQAGDVYKLQSCHVQITHVRRTREKGKWVWVATFVTHRPEGKIYILGRRGGYVHDPAHALKAGGELHGSTTIDAVSLDERSEAHKDYGDPPEPEAIPPHQVETLPTSAGARRRFDQQRRRLEQERRTEQLAGQLKKLQRRAASRPDGDITEVLDAVQLMLDRAERDLVEAA